MFRFAAVLIASGSLVSSAFCDPPAGALTKDGYGTLRIGMAERDALQTLQFSDPGWTEDSQACHTRASTTIPGLAIMVESGWVTRIAIFDGRRVKTDKGIMLGSKGADVRAAYSPLRRETAPYKGEPDHELYFQPEGREANGLRFSIDAKGIVEAIYAGGRSIEYMESCL